MTFEEYEESRENSIKIIQEVIEAMIETKEDSELNKLFDSAYTNTVTDEIREYNKSIMITLIEGDLHQIAVALNKIAGTMPKAPEMPPYVAEIEAEYKKWINIPYIRKPLAKALYEVWKKHDREDAERR